MFVFDSMAYQSGMPCHKPAGTAGKP